MACFDKRGKKLRWYTRKKNVTGFVAKNGGNATAFLNKADFHPTLHQQKQKSADKWQRLMRLNLVNHIDKLVQPKGEGD